MKSVSDDTEQVATVAFVSARVLADAQRSFAAAVDAVTLEQQVHEVVSRLWTESTTVTSFIPLLALRDLRDRLSDQLDVPRA